MPRSPSEQSHFDAIAELEDDLEDQVLDPFDEPAPFDEGYGADDEDDED